MIFEKLANTKGGGAVTYVEVSKKLVVVNTISSLLTQLFSLTFLFWLHRYLLQRISTEEYGLLPVVMTVMVFAPLLTTIFTSGVGRYLIEAYAQGNKYRVTQIVSSIMTFIVGVASLVSILRGVFVLHIDKLLNIPAGRVSEALVTVSKKNGWLPIAVITFDNILLNWTIISNEKRKNIFSYFN